MSKVPEPKRKFNPDTLKRLYDAIEMGMTYEHACKYAGITSETLRNWRAGNFPKYVTEEQKDEFYEHFERSEGEGVMTKMALVMDAAANGNWQAAAWALERRYPDSYGRVIQRVEHGNAEGKPLEVNVSSSQIERLIESLPLDKLDAIVGLAEHIKGLEASENKDVIDVDSHPVERQALPVGVRHERDDDE